MSWSISKTGTRQEIEDALNAEANCPDSVKGFFANASAYYTDDTQLTFNTSGHHVQGAISNCNIGLQAQAPPVAEQLPTEEAEPKGNGVERGQAE